MISIIALLDRFTHRNGSKFPSKSTVEGGSRCLRAVFGGGTTEKETGRFAEQSVGGLNQHGDGLPYGEVKRMLFIGVKT